MSLRTLLTSTFQTSLRTSTLPSRACKIPTLLTQQQSRTMATDIPKTADTVTNTTQEVKQAASNLAEGFDRSGKSNVGAGSGTGDMGNPIYDAADAVGSVHSKSTENPSVLSSGGAIGKQFNPDGNIGQIGEKIGGPFAKDGVIGKQFDAAGGGVAGTVEKLVDGPSQKKPGDAGYKGSK